MSVLEGTNPQDLITEDWDIADLSASNDLLREDLVDQLSIIAEDIGLPHDSDILMSRVSDGSIIPEHSEDLQIHGTQCSWHQYYPVYGHFLLVATYMRTTID